MSDSSDHLPDSALLRLPEVIRLCGGWSRSSIYRAIKAGRFPPPVQLGLRRVAWKWADVRAWLASRPSLV